MVHDVSTRVAVAHAIALVHVCVETTKKQHRLPEPREGTRKARGRHPEGTMGGTAEGGEGRRSSRGVPHEGSGSIL